MEKVDRSIFYRIFKKHGKPIAIRMVLVFLLGLTFCTGQTNKGTNQLTSISETNNEFSDSLLSSHLRDSWEVIEFPPDTPAVDLDTGRFIPDKYTVLLYHFDDNEAYTTEDKSKGCNHGYSYSVTLENNESYNSYGAFHRDGYIRVAHSPELVFPTAYTVELWTKPDPVMANADYPKLITKPSIIKGSTEPTFVLDFSIKGNQKNGPLAFGAANKNHDFQTLSSGVAASKFYNTWTYVAASFGQNEMRIYINGEQVASMDFVGTLKQGNLPMYIGNVEFVKHTSFQGGMDEIRVSTCCRSPEAIRKTYALQKEHLFFAD